MAKKLLYLTLLCSASSYCALPSLETSSASQPNGESLEPYAQAAQHIVTSKPYGHLADRPLSLEMAFMQATLGYIYGTTTAKVYYRPQNFVRPIYDYIGLGVSAVSSLTFLYWRFSGSYAYVSDEYTIDKLSLDAFLLGEAVGIANVVWDKRTHKRQD